MSLQRDVRKYILTWQPVRELKSPSRATIADVAERAGVSIATVSRVINQSAPVAEDTVQRVRAAIAELN